MTRMESMRGESDGVVNDAITAVEVVALAAGKKGKFDKAQIHDILRHGNRIVTLAGTFGYVSLDIASRSLCDVTDRLLSADIDNLAPILVHPQAIRMIAPGATPLKADEIEQVLAELEKVSAHFNVVPLADSAARLEIEPAADAT